MMLYYILQIEEANVGDLRSHRRQRICYVTNTFLFSQISIGYRCYFCSLPLKSTLYTFSTANFDYSTRKADGRSNSGSTLLGMQGCICLGAHSQHVVRRQFLLRRTRNLPGTVRNIDVLIIKSGLSARKFSGTL